jgi:hypothetical protein
VLVVVDAIPRSRVEQTHNRRLGVASLLSCLSVFSSVLGTFGWPAGKLPFQRENREKPQKKLSADPAQSVKKRKGVMMV